MLMRNSAQYSGPSFPSAQSLPGAARRRGKARHPRDRQPRYARRATARKPYRQHGSAANGRVYRLFSTPAARAFPTATAGNRLIFNIKPSTPTAFDRPC